MTAFRRRVQNLALLVFIAWCAGSAAAIAQPAPEPTPFASLEEVSRQVPVGSVVLVTDRTGATAKGRLRSAADEAIRVDVESGTRTILAGDIRRIRWLRSDSLLNGMLIWAALGAIPGIYFLAVDPNECAGMCPEEYGLIAVGGAVGALIDHFIARTTTVYVAPVVGRRAITIAPSVARDGIAVRAAVGF